MIILKGYERSKGVMPTNNYLVDKTTGEAIREEIEYDKYSLHYVSDERERVVGLFCDNVSASASKLQLIGADSLDAMIGKQVIFGFDMTAKPDKNGRVVPSVTSIICLEVSKK